MIQFLQLYDIVHHYFPEENKQMKDLKHLQLPLETSEGIYLCCKPKNVQIECEEKVLNLFLEFQLSTQIPDQNSMKNYQ